MPTTGDIYHFDSKKGESESPIVLVHGAGGTHLHWPYNLRRINNHRVFAPDLPGHGKSGGLGEQSVKKYAAFLVDWMDKVGLKQAVVGGHSMGGAIAQTFALNYPDRISALILVGTGAKLSVNQDLLHKLSSTASTPTAIANIVKWSYAPGTDSKLLTKMKDQLLGVRSAVLYGDYLACDNFDVTDRLSEISVPTLIVCGEVDKMTPVDLSKQLQAQISQASLHLVPDAGHMVMLEKPDNVAQAVTTFIRELG
ncbi:MAG TPA: alpha/beta hydrolase [Anaerolineales bacterium]|nr:alpha/beta hydrolase [Anaerolineales bacterium]